MYFLAAGAFLALCALGAIAVDWLATVGAVLWIRHRGIAIALRRGSLAWALAAALLLVGLVSFLAWTRHGPCFDITGLDIEVCGRWIPVAYLPWGLFSGWQSIRRLKRAMPLLRHHYRVNGRPAIIAVGPARWLPASGEAVGESITEVITSLGRRS